LRPEILNSINDKRVHIHHTDGRAFIRNAARESDSRKYDLVWVDVPDPSTISLNRFFTIEFYRDVRALLSEDGVMATQVSSAVNYFGEVVLNYLGSVAGTIKEVFPEFVVTPGDRAFVFATPSTEGILSTNPEELIARYNRSEPDTPNFSPLVFHTLLDPSQRELVERTVESSLESSTVNTDMHPLAYFHNLMIWLKISGMEGKGLSRLTKTIRLPIILAVLLFMITTRVIYLSAKRPMGRRVIRSHGLLLLAVTGFTAMSLEIIIMIIFQSSFGYLYEKVGLIVSSFMAGLVAGGILSTKYLPPTHEETMKKLMYVQFFFLIFLLLWILYFVLQPGRYNEVIIYLATMAFGTFAGFEFPLVGHMLVISRHSVGRSAGLADSLDHVGAAAGSFVTGIVLIPALGIVNTLICLGALKAGCLVLLVVTRGINEKSGSIVGNSSTLRQAQDFKTSTSAGTSAK
jgi:spermidine synthase